MIYLVRFPVHESAVSELAALRLRNLDDDLAPGTPGPKGQQGVGDALKPNELAVREDGALELALLDEVADALPDDGDGLALEAAVGAPVDADEADALEQHLVHGHLLDVAGGEADDQDAPFPRDALGALVDDADGVVHDVDAAPAGGQAAHDVGPGRVAVVDGVVGAEGARDLELTRRSRRRDDRGAQRLGDLDGGQADAAGRRVHQDDLAGLDVRALHQGAVARRRRHEEPRRVRQRPAFRHGQQVVLAGAQARREGALARAEHAAPDGEPRRGLGRGRHRHHNPRELATGCPGKRWEGAVPQSGLVVSRSFALRTSSIGTGEPEPGQTNIMMGMEKWTGRMDGLDTHVAGSDTSPVSVGYRRSWRRRRGPRSGTGRAPAWGPGAR